SRRRHTRFSRDWSSDVCSSDLSKSMLDEIGKGFEDLKEVFTFSRIGNPKQEILTVASEWAADLIIMGTHGRTGFDHFISGSVSRSEERRVGKECRDRGSRDSVK